jgi:hypothetical protein
MENTKLTLSIDKDTVQLAKEIASEDHISVSKLFKMLISEVAKKRKKKDPLLDKLNAIEIPEDIKALTGILKGKYPENMDYKDMKYEYLKEKYGL